MSAPRTFVTADLHLQHTGILSFERHAFKSIDEHDEYVIRSLNRYLSPDDTLYVLGDVGFRKNGDLHSLGRLVRRIECRRKVLIYGNHDHFSETEALSVLGFDEVHKGPVYYESADSYGKIILSHQPVVEARNNPYVINVHGHIHNGDLAADGFYNVNIAQTGYVPQDMRKFVNIARKRKSRLERFGDEWYYDLYRLKGDK